MGADIAYRERRVRSQSLLKPQRVRNQGRHFHVRLDASGNEERIGRRRGLRRDRKPRDGKVGNAIGGIEARVLVHAVAERILQFVIHAEPCTQYGPFGKRTPGYADSGLRKELRVVGGEGVARNPGLGGDDTVGVEIVCGAAMRFIPSGRELGAEAKRDGQLRTETYDILSVERPKQRAPIERSWRRVVQEAAGGSGEKGLEAGEGGLAVLAEGDVFVGLKLLEPCAKAELMSAAREPDTIFVGIQIAGNG